MSIWILSLLMKLLCSFIKLVLCDDIFFLFFKLEKIIRSSFLFKLCWRLLLINFFFFVILSSSYIIQIGLILTFQILKLLRWHLWLWFEFMIGLLLKFIIWKKLFLHSIGFFIKNFWIWLFFLSWALWLVLLLNIYFILFSINIFLSWMINIIFRNSFFIKNEI